MSFTNKSSEPSASNGNVSSFRNVGVCSGKTYQPAHFSVSFQEAGPELYKIACKNLKLGKAETCQHAQIGQVMRKGVLCHMRTTKVQISLRICTV